MPTQTLATDSPALCIGCGEKAQISVYSRIWNVEITACRKCVDDITGGN